MRGERFMILIGVDDLTKDIKGYQEMFPKTYTTMKQLKTSLRDRTAAPIDCVFGIEVSSDWPEKCYTFEANIVYGMTFVRYLGISKC